MSLLDGKFRDKIMNAYACIMKANKWLPPAPKSEYDHRTLEHRELTVKEAAREIELALTELERFLESTSGN